MSAAWWWVALALAGPVRSEVPSQPLSQTLPPGVTSALVSRELVAPRPPTVTLAVDPRPVLRDGLLVVRAVVRNTGTRPAKAYLVSAPHTGGPFLLIPRGIAFNPPPLSAEHPGIPETLPCPMELALPAGAEVVYESALRMDRYAWPASGAVDLDWAFAWWDEPAKGTLPGQLAAN